MAFCERSNSANPFGFIQMPNLNINTWILIGSPSFVVVATCVLWYLSKQIEKKPKSTLYKSAFVTLLTLVLIFAFVKIFLRAIS